MPIGNCRERWLRLARIGIIILIPVVAPRCTTDMPTGVGQAPVASTELGDCPDPPNCRDLTETERDRLWAASTLFDMDDPWCEDLQGWFVTELIYDSVKAYDLWNTHEAPLGYHAGNHYPNDITFGVYHLTRDPIQNLAITAAHESAHHYYGPDESTANYWGQRCILE